MNHHETNDRDEDKISMIRLGLKANLNQFFITCVLVNAFVGAMIGLEQTDSLQTDIALPPFKKILASSCGGGNGYDGCIIAANDHP